MLFQEHTIIKDNQQVKALQGVDVILVLKLPDRVINRKT